MIDGKGTINDELCSIILSQTEFEYQIVQTSEFHLFDSILVACMSVIELMLTCLHRQSLYLKLENNLPIGGSHLKFRFL